RPSSVASIARSCSGRRERNPQWRAMTAIRSARVGGAVGGIAALQRDGSMMPHGGNEVKGRCALVCGNGFSALAGGAAAYLFGGPGAPRALPSRKRAHSVRDPKRQFHCRTPKDAWCAICTMLIEAAPPG